MSDEEVKQTPAIDVGVTIAGRYEVIGLIGQGGCARVFKGLERGGSFSRDVAIKVLRSENFPTDELRTLAKRRLRHEAEISVRVAHHNVVTLLHDGKFKGEDYIILEYLPMTLESWLHGFRERGEVVPFEQIKAIGCALGEGLEAIHAVDGAVHRDIKPSNILLRRKPDGSLVVKIGDLGLVKLSDKALTRAGEYIGTDGYTPADGLKNGGPPADCRIDLFGLGCVLFEAATGHKAFLNRDDALNEKPAMRASFYRQPFPIKLDNVIAQLLEKNPAQRYASSTAFLRDWAEFFPDGPMLHGEANSEKVMSVIGDGPRNSLHASTSTLHELMNVGHGAHVVQEDYAGQASDCDIDLGEAGPLEEAHPAPTSKPVVPAFSEPELGERAQGIVASLNRGEKKAWMSLKRRDAVLWAFPPLLLVMLFVGLAGKRKDAPEPESLPVVTAPGDRSVEVSGRDLMQDARRLKSEITRPEITTRPSAPALPNSTGTGANPLAQSKASGTQGRLARAARAAVAAAKPQAVEPQRAPEEEQSFQIDLTPRRRGTASQSVGASVAEGKSLGVPASTTVRARLINPISSQSPYSGVVAELEDDLSVAYRTVAPKGARLMGRATHQQRGGKHFVDVRFDKLVDLQSGKEWRIDAVAMESRLEGLQGQVKKVDERNKSNGWQTAVNAVDDALSGEAAGRFVRPFTRDQSDDARKLHRAEVIVTVPESRSFEVMFRSAV